MSSERTDMSLLQETKPFRKFCRQKRQVNYMGPFIPNLSSFTAPLRELTKDKNVFGWNPSHQVAFDKVKNSISDETTLTYFDPEKETTLQVDASMRGLGAVL